MKIDVHGYELWEAIEEIVRALEECHIQGDSRIEIVHGYRKGQVLKNYIRSDGFLREIAREGYKLKRIKSENPGVSFFKLI